jgi:hypothetical protein
VIDVPEERVQITLPRAVSMRIASVLAVEALAYVDVEDFIFTAIREELRRAEGKRSELEREARL